MLVTSEGNLERNMKMMWLPGENYTVQVGFSFSFFLSFCISVDEKTDGVFKNTKYIFNPFAKLE